MLPKALFLSTIEKIRQQKARIDEFDKALSKMCDGFPAFDKDNLYLLALRDLLKYTMLRMVSSLQKTAIFNHKLNDKPKELWYSTVRNQEQISTERTQNYEDYFFRYLLYERMAGYLPVRGI